MDEGDRWIMNKTISIANALLLLFFIMLIMGWFSGWMTTSLPVLINWLKHLAWIVIKIAFIFGLGFALGRYSLEDEDTDEDDSVDQN